jgi:hypothetical protein
MTNQKRVTNRIPLPSDDRTERFSGGRLPTGNSSNLISELVSQYNKNNDLGVIRGWFRKNRHKANENHLTALFERVQHVREHAQGLSDFKAELITQQERLEIDITRILEASEIALEQQREEHKSFVARHQVERERVYLELARLQLENEKIKLEHEQMKANTRLSVLRGNLIEKITNDLDLNNITPQQAFVLIKALNQASTESDFFLAQEQLDQMRAEADMKTAEARKAGFEADLEEFKLNETKKTPKE